MKKKNLLVGLFLGLTVFASAQQLILDPEFNTGTGADGYVYLTKQLADGKILVGGQFTQFNGQPANRLVKLNADGSTDTAFTAGNIPSDLVGTAIEEQDGKLVIGARGNKVIRLNADGSLDTSFTPPVLSSGYDIVFIAAQGDKYLVSSTFILYPDQPQPTYHNLARLNHDGTLDTTFNPTSFSESTYARVYALADGKILVVGKFSALNGQTAPNIIRLTADGAIDTTFTADAGSAGGQINAVAVQPDGKYVIGGQFIEANGLQWKFVKRLNEDGTEDTSFSPVTGDGVRVLEMVLQPDGKIVTAGWFHDSYVDLNAPTDDSIIRYMERFNPDGSSYEFQTGVNTSATVNTIGLQTDGKLLAGGWFENYGDTPVGHFVRLMEAPLSTENQFAENITVYPNPVSNILTIKLPVSSTEGQLYLYDVSGKQLKNQPLTGQVDMSAYQSGIYLLKLVSGTMVTVHKIVKK